MSTISSAIDIIVAAVQTALPNHTYMVNGYEPEENPTMYMNQGVGIAWRQAINTNREICKIYQAQSFDVVITRNYFASDLNIGDKESQAKQILEDALLVIRALHADVLSSLNQSVAICKYLGHNGIETVFGDKDNYLKATLNFEFDYYDTLT
jgi:hypothetical protein